MNTVGYDHWPHSWRVTAAMVVNQFGELNRTITTATLASISRATIYRCVVRARLEVQLHPTAYDLQTQRDLAAVWDVLHRSGVGCW